MAAVGVDVVGAGEERWGPSMNAESVNVEARDVPVADPRPERRNRTRRQRLKIRFRQERYKMRLNPHWNRTYRAGVGAVGTLMILCGAVMVPLPTPGFGWILIFLGLAVLSSEFVWAQRLSHWVRRGYDWVRHHYNRLSLPAKIGAIVALVILLLVILWLFGMFGTAASWVGIERDWLRGPIMG